MAKCLILFIIILTGVITTVRPARAQPPAMNYHSSPVAALQCDASHNRLLVRFGATQLATDDTRPDALITDGDYVPVPNDLTKGWENFPYHLGGSCNFKNGQKNFAAMSFIGLGSSGSVGEATANFELTINGRIIYDNIPFALADSYLTSAPQQNAGFQLAAIYYDGSKLQECLPGLGQDASSGPAKNVKCEDVSYRLSAGYRFTDPIESAW